MCNITIHSNETKPLNVLTQNGMQTREDLLLVLNPEGLFAAWLNL